MNDNNKTEAELLAEKLLEEEAKKNEGFFKRLFSKK